MKDWNRRLRLWVQLAFFAATGALLWPALQWMHAPRLVAQSSSFIAIVSIVALRAVGAGTLVGLGFAVLALWKRRLFCRYVCPVGLLVEGATRAGFQKRAWWRRCPAVGRYVALITLIGSIVGYPILTWTDPLAVFSGAFSIRTAGNATEGILAGFLLDNLYYFQAPPAFADRA